MPRRTAVCPLPRPSPGKLVLVFCDGHQGRGKAGFSFILSVPHPPVPTQLLRNVTLPHLFLDVSSRLGNTSLCPVCPGPVLLPCKREPLKPERRWAEASRIQAGMTVSPLGLVLCTAPLSSVSFTFAFYSFYVSMETHLTCQERFPD